VPCCHRWVSRGNSPPSTSPPADDLR